MTKYKVSPASVAELILEELDKNLEEYKVLKEECADQLAQKAMDDVTEPKSLELFLKAWDTIEHLMSAVEKHVPDTGLVEELMVRHFPDTANWEA